MKDYIFLAWHSYKLVHSVPLTMVGRALFGLVIVFTFCVHYGNCQCGCTGTHPQQALCQDKYGMY